MKPTELDGSEIELRQDNSIGFQILRAIRRIIRRTSDHSRNVGKHGGVSVPQMLCLKAVSEFPENTEVTVAMIAHAVQLSAPTVSRILDKLDGDGYVARERNSKDRRRVCVSLTDKGRQRLNSLPTPLHEQFLTRLETLDPIECLGLLKALERIVKLMDAEGIDAAPILIPDLEVSPNHVDPDDRISQ
ncbi:MarR family winged helix-turn-helix transcriptional regulator [Stieleria varia]|uniref:Transcriptional regulator SlyA n=1 Tax=Stieleria varia TaxID=2528005 RepID=A0A5C6A6H8_9BACT|nr:MarR family transcriptional regulator [Stieleria varia]TWT94671.1 transcriptional regulator SlyA [Stieleria varia]